MKRFLAEITDYADSLGQKSWVVIDTAHNRVEQEFDGYFAEADAKRLADTLNTEEAAMAAGEE